MTATGACEPMVEAGLLRRRCRTTPQRVDTSLGWHGGDDKITDGGLVHMGARPYSPAHGRFLAVDPIEGGCANDYTYVHGDPINQSDLSGTNWLSDKISGAAKAVKRFAGKCVKGFGKIAVGFGAGVGLALSPWELAHAAEAAGRLGVPSGAAAITEGTFAAGGALTGSTVFGVVVLVSVVTVSCVEGHKR